MASKRSEIDVRQRMRAGRIALTCLVSPGMFSNERLVLLTLGDKDYAMYVDEMIVDVLDESAKRDAEGRIWVSARATEGTNYVVELPEEGQIVTVPKDSVVSEFSR